MPRACGRTSPHAARTEPRDTRAAAPPPPHATLANGGDRAPRRDAGAVAAGSVRRYLDAHDGVPARVARTTSPAVRDRQGDGDTADAAPRHAARLWAHPGGLSLGDEAGETARPVGARTRSRGPVTSAEALAHLESEYGLAGVDARRAWQTVRLAAHLVHDPETAFWQPRNEQRFVAIKNRRRTSRSRRAPRFSPLPRGLRPLDAPRHRSLEHDPRGRDRRCAGAARAAAPLPRRAGPRAPRRPTSAAAGRRDHGARTLPAEVGQRPARLGRPHARAPGATGRR